MESIYLDNAATTKICEKALNEFVKCENECSANASSLHSMGQKSAAKLEEARDKIAYLIGAYPDEIYFTCGATEGNNICLRGYSAASAGKVHIITSETEHPSVLNTVRELESQGHRTDYLGVDENCMLSEEALEQVLYGSEHALVSIMHTNNEVGVINPIKNIAETVHAHGGVFHCDAVQAMGKTKIDVKELGVDMLTSSAHKFHGPRGVGFMYVRRGIKLAPVTFGGGQERRLRPGTVNTSAISAMATALETACNTDTNIEYLRNKLVDGIKRNIPGVRLNGESANRITCIANFSFPGVASDKMLYALDRRGLCVSAGSACSAGSLEISHVIKAMGADKYGAAVRFSLSRLTTEEEVEKAVEITSNVYNNLVR